MAVLSCLNLIKDFLSHLKLRTLRMMDFCHWPHFTDEETKSLRILMTLSCYSDTGHSQDMNSGLQC